MRNPELQGKAVYYNCVEETEREEHFLYCYRCN